MSPVAWTYVVYLLVSAYITVVVGRILHRNGRPFLVDVFHGDERLADTINHLLLVGYYLVNFAFVLRMVSTSQPVFDWESALHVLMGKLGTVQVVLGGMHFLNVAVLWKVRRWSWNTATPIREFLPDA